MNLKFLLLALSLVALPVSAQTLQGVVANEKGSFLPYAAIYIRECKSGVTTNLDGTFSIPLQRGDYHLEISAFGYSTSTFTVHQSDDNSTVRFQLHKRDYTSPPLTSSNDDEVADSIILNAIDKSSYNRSIIGSYTADLYVKGRGALVRVPAMQMISKSNRLLARKYLNKLFVTEKNYQIDYRSPYTYDIRLLADTRPLPLYMKSDMKITTASIYDRTLYSKLSPIAPEAFNYYRYHLVCTLRENGQKIYKIQVSPIHLASELVSGYVYIVDKLWCISAFDLLLYNSHNVSNIKVRCAEIMPTVFAPVCAYNEMDIHRDGIHTLAQYTYSLRYRKIEENMTQNTPISSNYFVQGAKHFERLRAKDLIHLGGDTLKSNTDSVYWNRIRPVPLLPEEIYSYSLITPDSVARPFHAKDWSDVRTWYNLVRYGDTFRNRSGKLWLDCYSIASCVPDYNFVDGLWIGYKMGMGMQISPSTSLIFTPALYYTTARHKWIGTGNITLRYAPRSDGQFIVEGGSLTADYNGETGESRFFNAISALIYADNYIKLYNQKFLTVKNSIEIADGLTVTTAFDWESRKMIENNIHHSILGQNAEINHPLQDPDFDMPFNKLLSSTIALQYTPNHYYKIVDNKKVYEETECPTLTFGYTQAYSIGGRSIPSSRFSKLQTSIQQTVLVGLFNRFIWNAESGLFFHRKNMQFPDYHHFPTVQNTSSRRPFSYGFFLLDCYTYSTDDRWLMVNTTWNTPYLLIKYLPMFRVKNFDEAIHARLLITPEAHPYFECGYSAGVKDISRLGFFMGFNQHGYHSVGISLSFAM
jgi:hypothetical protein